MVMRTLVDLTDVRISENAIALCLVVAVATFELVGRIICERAEWALLCGGSQREVTV